jgi:predicted patatin/cPLA2 family phospholipase
MSGGGTKGFCTLGALQYMRDNLIINDKIENFIGTSVGSIISYFLAIGYTPIEIVVYLCSNNVLENLLSNISGIFNFSNISGIYNYSSITKHCEIMTLLKINYIPTLKQLKDNFNKTLIICTYNLTKHKREYVSYINYPDMSCLDAIRLSSNIPFIFEECIYNGDEYIDGGVIDNFPTDFNSFIETISDKDISAIGICLEDREEEKKIEGETDNSTNYYKILKLINKIYNIIMIPCKEKKEYNKNIDIINIKVEDLKIYNFSLSHTKKLELFSYGYNYAKHYFEYKNLEDTILLRNI